MHTHRALQVDLASVEQNTCNGHRREHFPTPRITLWSDKRAFLSV